VVNKTLYLVAGMKARYDRKLEVCYGNTRSIKKMNNGVITVVTGASSIVGIELVRHLSASRQKVRAAVHDLVKHYMTSLGLEVVNLDYSKLFLKSLIIKGICTYFYFIYLYI
jgi:hypothetical protein